MRCWSSLVWACSGLEIRDEALVCSLAELIAHGITTCSPEEISDLLYAFGKMQLPFPDLFDAALARMLQVGPSSNLSTTMLSKMTWAFASTGYSRQHPALAE